MAEIFPPTPMGCDGDVEEPTRRLPDSVPCQCGDVYAGVWGSGGRRVLPALVAAGILVGAGAQATGDARGHGSGDATARTRVATVATTSTSTTEVPTTTVPVTPIQWSACG